VKKRRSLRWQIFVPINAAVIATVIVFLVWDSVSEWRVHIEEKRASLRAEAETILAAVLLHENDPHPKLEAFITDAWRAARAQGDESPGHHIVVQIGSTVLRAPPGRRTADALLGAMRDAAASPDSTGPSEDGRIVVGAASRGGTSVWVSELLTDIQRLIQRQIGRRIASIGLLAGAIAIVINLLVNRLVERPVRGMVEAVRSLRAGQLGVQTAFASSEELAFLAEEFNAMSTGLAAADHDRRWQMDKARRIQEHLLPACGTTGPLTMACLCEPASEVGGDFYDVRVRPDGVVLVCMADVTGHGVPAAMGAAILKILFAGAVDRSAAPDAIAADISRGFAAVTLDDVFASMIVVAIYIATEPAAAPGPPPAAGAPSSAAGGAPPPGRGLAGRFLYASAGHPPAYLLRPGRPMCTLQSTGPLLGIHDIKEWRTVEIETAPGDRLVLVTDGLMDAASASGERFSLDRLEAAIALTADVPLTELPRRIVQDVRSFCGDRPQEDDMTLVALEFQPRRERRL
jgi:sigma-B regulation protein RsbU (phosphoserine phosphatase)